MKKFNLDWPLIILLIFFAIVDAFNFKTINSWEVHLMAAGCFVIMILIHWLPTTSWFRKTRLSSQYYIDQKISRGEFIQTYEDRRYIYKITELAEAGFLCDISTDGWANWRFEDGKPNKKTATPSGMSFGWRGCYSYFDKDGNLCQDDIGCYNEKNGGLKACLESLFEAYDELKDDVDSNGFVEKHHSEWIIESTKQI